MPYISLGIKKIKLLKINCYEVLNKKFLGINMRFLDLRFLETNFLIFVLCYATFLGLSKNLIYKEIFFANLQAIFKNRQLSSVDFLD